MGGCVAKQIESDVVTKTDRAAGSGASSASLVKCMGAMQRLYSDIQEEVQSSSSNNIRQAAQSSTKVRRYIASSACGLRGRRFEEQPTEKGDRMLYFQLLEMGERLYFEKTIEMGDLEAIKNSIDDSDRVSWQAFFQALQVSFHMGTMSAKLVQPQDPQKDVLKVKLSLDLNFGPGEKHTIGINMRYDATASSKLISDVFVMPLFQFYQNNPERQDTSDKVNELQNELRGLKTRCQKMETESFELQHQLAALIAQQAQNNGEAPTPQILEPTTIVNPRKNLDEDSLIWYGEKIDLVNVRADHVGRFLKEIKKRLLQMNVLTDVEKDSFTQVINQIALDSLYSAIFDTSQMKREDMNEQTIAWLKNNFSMKDSTDDDGRDTASLSNNHREASEEEFKSRLDSARVVVPEKTRSAILQMFDQLDNWYFDSFMINENTDGHILFNVGYTLFLRYDLLNKFKIDEQVLIDFLKKVEASYNSNPYHNAMHAADVTQGMHFIISKGGMLQYMTDEDVLCGIFSAIVHDLDHPGLNNAFQISAGSYLATLYNDVSVLENHHAARAFEICRDQRLNIFKNLSSTQYRYVRETIVDTVLATDMGQHAAIVAKFRGRIEAEADFTAKDDVRLLLQMAIKISDISNPARPTKLYLKWTQRISDEFYAQGDREREYGLPVSPLMDRNKHSQVGKGQIAFMTYVIAPTFDVVSKALPEMAFTLNHVNENKEYWNTHTDFWEGIQEAEQQAASNNGQA